ncbi:hypothetical protein [Microbacterium sp. NPDC091662]|uniref:hypothetical protein n=1 Tax=Microbacterium sp. NPDC091662 TaxID=3364211 RepID=UPI0038254786
MKITTGLTPSVRKWVLPAGSAHISLGGVALSLPTSGSGATLVDRVDLFVLELAASADSAEAREGTAQSFTLVGSEPIIHHRRIEYVLHDGPGDRMGEYEAHMRARYGAPDDALVRDYPLGLYADGIRRELRWYEVTI